MSPPDFSASEEVKHHNPHSFALHAVQHRHQLLVHTPSGINVVPFPGAMIIIKTPPINVVYHLNITTVSTRSDSRIDIPPASESWKDPGVKGKTHRARQTIQLYIWDDQDKPAKEEHFLFKLDFFVLSYACLGYFCKSLDQANINNAYVSGMNEAINMQGSQLTYVRNALTVGYVLSDIPAVILVTKIRPSILIPTLEPGFIAAATFGVAVILVSNSARILEGRDSKSQSLR
ncbi:pantothenate transporter liz1 [Drepanopeziza brunnea f. sp. 'multigermtubi' MB_m1]|uniref:Pantothenate transporter liz1 n=1 Tax=Marssonina brunnea f. sp. multigermtubi (strain MB_m1) TaxID=1072389 RepID=K1WFH3_MARBU|nr:pantothenate transporter liz1 [Drepanopeziza brunnea f. sp. 'multigermtubi' MB_m1]EKD16175.1 pantothenate transporter liz1 [Drepanopeziza brunnea f. sp. 'multigermtubi' MB_m1]